MPSRRGAAEDPPGRGQQYYPQLVHNANWASLAAGAAMTPIEWNDGRFAYGRFDAAMAEDMARLAVFVEETPLVAWNPVPLELTISDAEVRGWGVAGKAGGLVWVQDFALEGESMDTIRADQTVRSGLAIQLDNLGSGQWQVTPYDTWQGTWLESLTIECPATPCNFVLPDFQRDLALKLERQ